MLSQRLMFRASGRALSSFRHGGGGSMLQRRFASSGKPEVPEGLPDNDFNRERAAVKAHAAATSGMVASYIAIEICLCKY